MREGYARGVTYSSEMTEREAIEAASAPAAIEIVAEHYATIAPPHVSKVGRGPALLMPMRTLVDTATDWFRTTRT